MYSGNATWRPLLLTAPRGLRNRNRSRVGKSSGGLPQVGVCGSGLRLTVYSFAPLGDFYDAITFVEPSRPGLEFALLVTPCTSICHAVRWCNRNSLSSSVKIPPAGVQEIGVPGKVLPDRRELLCAISVRLDELSPRQARLLARVVAKSLGYPVPDDADPTKDFVDWNDRRNLWRGPIRLRCL